ncbi:MAG: TatD family hydrolase [Salinivirgaceae bacterium]
MEFIDTHAHLYAEEFVSDKKEVIQRAINEGVTKIVLPAIDSKHHQSMITMAEQNAGVLFPLIGLHPTSVNSDYKKELSIIENYLSQRSLFYGIGEIGIDLYWDKTHFKEQLDAFVTQVKWAIEMDWPIVIHTRESFNEVCDALEPLVIHSLKGIFHCFGGTFEEANRINKIGFMLGIGGIATFKNSPLSHVLKQVELNHIVLETDSPYLAPVPYRGKRNESSYIKLVAKQLATIYQVPIEKIATQTTDNALRVFKL